VKREGVGCEWMRSLCFGNSSFTPNWRYLDEFEREVAVFSLIANYEANSLVRKLPVDSNSRPPSTLLPTSTVYIYSPYSSFTVVVFTVDLFGWDCCKATHRSGARRPFLSYPNVTPPPLYDKTKTACRPTRPPPPLPQLPTFTKTRLSLSP
jgi:hypothetical protein